MTLFHHAADMSPVAPSAADAPVEVASAQHGSGLASRVLRGIDAISDGLVRARGGYDQDGKVMPADVRGTAPRLGTWR